MQKRFSNLAGGSGTSPILDISRSARVATSVGKYVPADWSGENRSGVWPLGQRVLVLCDKPETITAGGIELAAEFVERAGMAAETGVLAATGEGAFAWMGDRIHRWEGRKPQPGDRVIIERYAGQLHLGADGNVYRLMEDKSIGGIIATETQGKDA